LLIQFSSQEALVDTVDDQILKFTNVGNIEILEKRLIWDNLLNMKGKDKNLTSLKGHTRSRKTNAALGGKIDNGELL
jgi:hypothetical protein